MSISSESSLPPKTLLPNSYEWVLFVPEAAPAASSLEKTRSFSYSIPTIMDDSKPHPSDPDTKLVQQRADKLISSIGQRWLEATLIILSIVGLLAFVGRYLDTILGTHPWCFIGGIVLAFPISQYLIYIRLKRRFK